MAWTLKEREKKENVARNRNILDFLTRMHERGLDAVLISGKKGAR